MADRSIITPELCRQLLRYDPETGNLFWRHRGREHFGSDVGFAVWNGRFPGKRALSSPDPRGYLTGAILSRSVFAHRVAWTIYHGAWPENQIDHINGVRHDNRICNLRSVTNLENSRNRARYRNGQDYPGVRQEGDKWSARIEDLRLGSFFTREEALAARKAAEICLGYHPNHGRER